VTAVGEPSLALRLAPTVPGPADALAPDVVVVGVRSDRLDDDSRLLDRALLDADGFDGTLGQTRFVAGADDQLCLAVGLGPANEVGPEQMRTAGAAASRAAHSHARLAVDLLAAMADGADRPTTVAHSSRLAPSEEERYRSKR